MNTDRDTALRELATVVAELVVDRWIADQIANADSYSKGTLTDEHTDKEM